MGQRIVRVDRDILRSALGLPPGTRIVDVSAQLYFSSDEVALKVECPDLPPVMEGNRIPEVVPFYRQGAGGRPEFIRWSEELAADTPAIVG